LKKELEAAEEAAGWLVTETDLEVKLALMRQCGDEAKHYRLIEKRLEALGVDVRKLAPLASGYSPMFTYLMGLGSTVERIAAGPFAREALAKILNDAFIELCEARGDVETAALYRDVIQPDEAHHHELEEGSSRASPSPMMIASRRGTPRSDARDRRGGPGAGAPQGDHARAGLLIAAAFFSAVRRCTRT